MTYLVDSYNHTSYAQVLEESDTATPALTKTYILGDDVLAQAAGSSDPQYLLYDGHGSTRQLVDSDGSTISDSYSYDGYGVMLGGNHTSATTPLLLLYAGERYDAPAIGTWDVCFSANPSHQN